MTTLHTGFRTKTYAEEFPTEDDHLHDDGCYRDCDCGRGRFKSCGERQYRSCYECYLDRLSDFCQCIICGRWHAPDFDTCFKCRPETRGRDDAARALRQLILWRDDYTCRYCGAVEGEMQVDQRLVRPACQRSCPLNHTHRIADDDGLRHTRLHVDHIVPCASGGRADEWNLQVLCFVCNIAKGSTWYPGCRHDRRRTELCRSYFLIARSYFAPDTRASFLAEVDAWRATRTWDPDIHRDWRRSQGVEVE